MESSKKKFAHLLSEFSSTSLSKLAICALALGLSTPVNAEYLAYCLESKGQSKYLSENPTLEFEPFTNDGMSSLVFALNYKNEAGKGVYYIDYRIGEGDWQRTRHPTYMLNYNPSSETYLIMVDASSEGYVETYLFRLDGENRRDGSDVKIGEVVWTQSRNGGTPKTSMFRATCFYDVK